MIRRLLLAAIIVALAIGVGACYGDQERDYSWFLKQLYDLDALTRLEPGNTCAQASSYDRASKYDAATGQYINWSANGDAGQYISVDPQTGEALMADLKGPGCIFRIWSANPQGKIRFYLDGATKPSYEYDFAQLFLGNIYPFVVPMVWNRAKMIDHLDRGGNPASDCFLPIPYAKSCRVTADKAHGQYYHVGYQTYAPGTKVVTFHLPLSDKEKAALEIVRAKWLACGEDPQRSAKSEVTRKTITVAPGATGVLADLKGPGHVRAFSAKIVDRDVLQNRSVLLRFYWDGSAAPSVDTPFSEFFGESYGNPNYKSLPLGFTDGMGYCYWRMPYQKSAKLTAVNQGSKPVKIEYTILTDATAGKDELYFHAKWRRDKISSVFEYPMVEATGRGNFVGDALFVDNVLGGWWGEGDEKSYVDGEKFPSMFGTGSEDYFGDAWGIHYFVNPTHGCPNSHDRIQCCYRWHISDHIPFTKSLRFTIENYAAFADVKNDYSSVAYWYQPEQASDFFTSTSLSDRAPLPSVIVGGATEAESAVREPDGAIAEIAGDEFSMGKALKLAGPRDTSYRIPINVAQAGKCVIEAYSKPGVAAPVEMTVQGKPVAPKVQMPAGINTITIRKTTDADVTIDYFTVKLFVNLVKEWVVVGPFPNPDTKTSLATDYGPEDGVDLAKSYTGKGGAEVKWQTAKSGVDGILDFTAVFTDHENAVTYAAVIVTSPDDRKTDLLLGSDDGVRVWLNGKEVWNNPVDRGVSIDEDRVTVEIKKGDNVLIFKVAQGAGGWGLAARVEDPDETLTYSVPK